MKLSWTTVIGGAFFLTTAAFFFHTFDPAYNVSAVTAGKGPVFFPRILLVLMALFSLGVIWQGTREAFQPIARAQFYHALGAIALTGIYIFAITWAGFLISSVVFIFALPWVLNYRNLKVIAAITAVYPVATWYLFEKVFKIILPSSPWFDWF